MQSIPTGGPKDTLGPYIKRIFPANGSLNINNNQNIEIYFNEMIDSKKVKSSIRVYPEVEIFISSFTNKIVIKPKEGWPTESLIKINISREISDYQGNKMNNGYILTYNTSSFMHLGKIFSFE